VQQHLRRQSGVAKVDVELEKGKVTVLLKEDASFDPARTIQAVFDSGVTVFEMIVTASGRVVKDPARGVLFETAPDQAFELVPNALAREVGAQAGSEAKIAVRARLYKKPEGKQKPKLDAPLKMEILEVLKGEAKQ
jgi:copper chaperone CopZ